MNLLLAAAMGKTKRVKVLIKAGVNVNVKDEYNWTALSGSASNGHIDIVKILIEAGANIKETDGDKFGETFFGWATNGKHPDIVKLLIKYGVLELRNGLFYSKK